MWTAGFYRTMLNDIAGEVQTSSGNAANVTKDEVRYKAIN